MKTWIEANTNPRDRIRVTRPMQYYPDLPHPSTRYSRFDPSAGVASLPKGTLLLASSFMYDRNLEHPDQQPPVTQFYRDLFSQGELLHESVNEPGRYLFQNPTLRLYRWK